MTSSTPTFGDTLRDRLNELRGNREKVKAGEVVTPYIPTGLRAWDNNGGILRGILTVIGAQTGDGKSILKLQLARGAASAGFRVCMVDFEDPAEKTADRAISLVTGIDNRNLGLLRFDDIELSCIEAAVKEMEPWADRISHHVGLTSTDQCLEILSNSKADLREVDYAQAFPEDENTTMERTIARFAWDANNMAQRDKCGMVVFSQIIRDVEQRGYRVFERTRFKDPTAFDVSGFAPGGLSDISWAKTLGERAKELGYIWRPGRIARKLGARVEDNRMRIIWGKVNFGGEKDMEFAFDGPTASIRDLK